MTKTQGLRTSGVIVPRESANRDSLAGKPSEALGSGSGGRGAERLEHAQAIGGGAAPQNLGELAAGQRALEEVALRVIDSKQAQDLGVLGRLDGLHDGRRAGPRGHLRR